MKGKVLWIVLGILLLFGTAFRIFISLPEDWFQEENRLFRETEGFVRLKKEPSFHGDGVEIWQGQVPREKRGEMERRLLREGWKRGLSPKVAFSRENSSKEEILEEIKDYQGRDVLYRFVNRDPQDPFDDEHTGNWTVFYYHCPTGTLTKVLVDT